jgi:hypothetical protein
VTEFHNEIRRRASEARQSLAEARATGDEYLAGIRVGEIQDLARLASEHGLVLDGVEDALAPYGLA